MMVAFMMRAVLTGLLVWAAALAGERIARFYRLPLRWIWSGAMLFTVLLPVAGLRFPGGLLRELGGGIPDAGGLPAGASLEIPVELYGRFTAGDAAGRYAGSLDVALVWVWVATSAALLLLFVWAAWRLRASSARGAAGRLHGVPVRITAGLGPAVVGLMRPAVVLPGWVLGVSAGERRMIVQHEWEHVRARDTLLLFVAAAVLVTAPWNLPLWWQHRRLRQAVETDCDGRLLARGLDRRAYAEVLLRTAGRSTAFPMLTPALAPTRSLLERRIIAMTYRIPRHRSALSLGLAAVAALLLTAACELASTGPASSPTAPVEPNIELAPTEPADPAEPAAPAEPPAPPAPEGEPTRIAIRGSADGGEWLAIEPLGESGSDQLRITVRGEQRQPSDGPGTLLARGVTLSGPDAPLILIDGVKVEKPEIDTNVIARIEVIKGAAAERIWGPEGKNGVIQITTKEAAEREGR